MATDSSALLQPLLAGTPLSASDVRKLLDAYPYFAVAAARAVAGGATQQAEDDAFRAIAACNVASPQALRKAFGSEPEPFYPDARQQNLSTSATIDAFMAVFGAKEESRQAPEPQAVDLRHLIAGKRYEEALALLEHQNLTNPEKSIYFADQIRYLRKLIINSKHLEK